MRKFGGSEVLEYAKRDLPPLKDDEVLVEIAGAGVNPIDTYIRKGVYAFQPELPFTPGLEGSGTVVAKGANAQGADIGDRIAFTITTGDGGFEATSGTYSKFCVVKAALALPVPKNLDLASAAALPIAYLAAHRALFDIGRCKPTDRVLVRGASGAVGLAAIHLARHFGAEGRVVVGTASADEAAGPWGERIKHWGASKCCSHDHDAIEKHGPYDLIVEQMARFNLDSDVRLLAQQGSVVIVGSPPQSDGRSLGQVDCRQLMTREAQVRGLFLWRQTTEERSKAAAAIFEAFEAFGESPPVRKMPLEKAKEAQDMIDPGLAKGPANTYDGKIILTPSTE